MLVQSEQPDSFTHEPDSFSEQPDSFAYQMSTKNYPILPRDQKYRASSEGSSDSTK